MLSATDRPSIICFIWDTVLLIIIVCNWFFLPAFPMDKYHQWIESEQLPFQMQLLSCLVRVANELGAGNGKGAKFATTVAVVTSVIIGLFFWLLIMMFHNEFGYIFTNSEPVLTEVSKLSLLLAFTILLNSVQPVLSGVAVGSGWQSYVAYINLGCYYLIGVPLGFLMGWFFHQGVMGIWAGMIFGGTAVQTLILAIITIRCDWDKEAEKASMHVLKWADKN